MERLSRLFLIIAVGLLAFQAYQYFTVPSVKLQPLLSEYEAGVEAAQRAASNLCTIKTESFEATLGADGAGIKHFKLLGSKYTHAGKSVDIATTPDLPQRRPLTMKLRNEGDAAGAAGTVAERNQKIRESNADPRWQLGLDVLPWSIRKSDGKSCEFGYRDATVELTKIVSATAHPYELAVSLSVKNLSNQPKRHALSVETTAWRYEEEVRGHMFRVSPFITMVECIDRAGSATRLRSDSFEGTAKGESGQPVWSKDSFKSNPLNAGDWYQVSGHSDLAAVSNAYFTQALFPVASPEAPACQLQIEFRYDAKKYPARGDDPHGGALYRARFAYPFKELKAGESVKYEVLSYMGPKERTALAAIGGGKHQALELIDLGYFSIIAKVLVGFLLAVHGAIGDLGLAIILLTITARTLLFPLTLPTIRMQLKMKALKPEMDALNERFKDDAQAKGLATMELYKKHKVNLAMGCLPQLITLPVWFALYTTLQTAVELYNISWLWFPDLTQPDPWFVLPVIIGSTAFLQQKLMPMNSGDPAQQQMMLYMMPIMMTVFMLFLPAGLGIYMFTNSLLGILQQQAVEWYSARALKQRELTVTVKADPAE